jgi:hypothetical protein
MNVRGEVIVVVEPYHVQVEVIVDSESAEVVL